MMANRPTDYGEGETGEMECGALERRARRRPGFQRPNYFRGQVSPFDSAQGDLTTVMLSEVEAWSGQMRDFRLLVH